MCGRRACALAAAFQIMGLAVSVGAWADGASVQAAPTVPVQVVQYEALLEGARAFDGLKATIQGEAIGQVMERGTMAWVNVADQSGAIGVWMSAEEARSISMLGSYSCRGDELRITGTFHRACVEHGGDMDIHAETVAIVRAGERVAHPFSVARQVAAALLSLAAAGGLLLLRSRDGKRRALESKGAKSGKGGGHGC